jgi:GTP-binding protein Era
MPRRPAFRAGTASLIGLPNAGKSTLLNALVGEKLAIVSSKPQTTRTALDGVLTTPAAQIVFVDTPGIHKSDTPYNQKMMRSVRASLDAIDVLVFVHDAQRVISTEVEGALDLVKKAAVPAILVLNKIDLVEDRQKVLALLEQFPKYYEFAAYVPISAQSGEGVETVRDEIIKLLPRASKIYPEDHITQMPSRFLAAEIIREKILAATHQEVPHAVAVLVETWEETPKLTRISATIYVERQGQKTIVIGQKGAALKAIGTAARLEMEEFFGTKIFLELFVKVRPDWRNQPEFLNELDWRRMTGERDE